MKKYISAIALKFAVSSHAFEVTGDSFTAKWKIEINNCWKIRKYH